MSKMYCCPILGIIILTLLLALPMSTPLIAQDNAEDVMDMELEDLLNVEITTAGKKAEKISEIPASVVLITRADIEKAGYLSLDEILENVPGMYVIDQKAHVDKTLGVRGFWASSTKGVIIMVNGVSQYQDIYGHYPLNKVAVPVEAIDRVEVVRGPMSVIYGSGAFYGAINIITNEEKTDGKSAGILSASYGSENRQRFFLRAAGGTEDYNFTMNAGLQRTNGIDVPWSDLSSMPYFGGADTDDFFASSSYYFNASSKFKDFYADFTIIRDHNVWIFMLLDLNNPNRKRSDFANAKLGWRKELSQKLTLDFKLGYYMTNVQSGNTWMHDPALAYLDYSHWELTSQALDIEGNADIKLSEKFNFTLGVYYRRLFHRQEHLNLPSIPYHDTMIKQPDDVHLKSYAAFVQANWNLSKKFKIVAGVRLEKVGEGRNTWEIGYGDPNHIFMDIPLEATDVQFIPRLAAIYSINEKNIIKLLYGKAVRNPNYHERNDGVPLEPEIINVLELNYIAALSPKFTVNISVYRNMLENLIYRREWMEGDVYYAVQTNEGKMNTTGFEVAIKTKPFKKFEMDLSVCYNDTEDENNPDRDVTCSPKLLGYGKIVYNFSENASLALTGNYVDKMAAQWNVAALNSDGTYGARRGEDTPSYLNLGVNLRLGNLFKKGWFVNFRISNLLDQAILYPTYSHSQWADKGTPGITRTFFVTVGKKF